jgi:formylglycine-generating enzyme required for sulfatase activity
LLPGDGEAPLRTTQIGAFAIDPFAVTNDWFAAFVAETGYLTEAERFGWSFVFFDLLPMDAPPAQGVVGAHWWRKVMGAHWRAPEGPSSSLDGRGRHPVTHVSLNDARTFAAWARGRLPSEVEWEYAARGGLGDVRYPWGDRDPDGRDFMPCNIWQGSFPQHNSVADGWFGPCPVDAFGPNGFGLYNMCGNVWEWCDQPLHTDVTGSRLMLTKGGSYLCHASYCHRYRIAARTGNTPDSTTGHIGFRLVFDLPFAAVETGPDFEPASSLLRTSAPTPKAR